MSLDRHRSGCVVEAETSHSTELSWDTRHSPDSDLKRFLPSKNGIWEWVGGLFLPASSGISRSQVSTGVTGGADSRETRVCNSEFQMVDINQTGPHRHQDSVAGIRKYQNQTPGGIERF